MRVLRIATRKSPLALWQAKHVAQLIQARHALKVELVELSTEGDRFLGAPLSRVGGKGLFVKEIEAAVIDGRADLAVHSLKDMTSQMPSELCLACVPEREDPRDAFVGASGHSRLFELPKGARVGTSSLRRSCQLLSRRPDLDVVSVRGNVQTRLQKIETLQLAGAVLAVAGLKRLGLEGRISEVLEPSDSLPAVGQGALAVQCRTDDAELRAWLEPLEHPPTRIAVTAERAFLAKLEGGCSVPLAAHATLTGDRLEIHGLVGSPDGKKVVRGRLDGPSADAAKLGEALAADLMARGAKEILDALKTG
ncbi:MAG: hydroxymethylbilane synthase [Myxococcaceae bacterium]|nr:hydroxymethylbilane synthase [Myxococcaceae bacterium]